MPEKKFVIPTPKPGPYPLGADSERHEGVPRGAVTQHEWRSKIFPNTTRAYWLYVPAQYSAQYFHVSVPEPSV